MVVTAAPLPGWKDIMSGLFSSTETDFALAAPWRRAGDYPFWFSRAAWAMQAVVTWWKLAIGKRTPIVWVPDYFCNQSLAPVRATGAKIIFYPIGPDLRPDWENRKINRVELPDLFFLVHYFGYQSDAHEARKFCDRFGAVLIEDAAHVLSPFPGVGEEGDFVFYSQHKLLAIPDGAVLLARPGIKRFCGNEEEKAIKTMVEVAKKMEQAWPQPWTWITKRAIQKIYSFNFRKEITYEEGCTGSPGDLDLNSMISPFSRRMLRFARSQMSFIAEQRRSNEAVLRRLFDHRPDWRPYPGQVQGEAVPYALILMTARPDMAEQIFRRINRNGGLVFSWPDLPPEVTCKPDEHKFAINLRKTLLAFPVHQSINLARLSPIYYKCLEIR